MTKRLERLGLSMVICLILFFIHGFSAQQSFKTVIYFDYPFDLTDDGYLTATRKDYNNRFIFRRAYFTYEHKISENINFRFRYDADRKADDKLRPFIKHLTNSSDSCLRLLFGWLHRL